jgi:anthranilate synthase component 1
VTPREKEIRALAERLEGGRAAAVSRVLPSDERTPVSLFRRLRAQGEECFLLESVEGGEHVARYTFLGSRPAARFVLGQDGAFEERGGRRRPIAGPALAALEGLVVRPGFVRDRDLPPLASGAVGWLSYDAVRQFERIPDSHPFEGRVPDGLFLLFEAVIAFDHPRQRLLFLTSAGPVENGREEQEARAAVSRLDALQERLADAAFGEGGSVSPRAIETLEGRGRPEGFSPLFSREPFLEAVRRAKEEILAGEVYQVVLSERWSAELDVDPFEVYRALRMLNPSPYMFYLEAREATVLGASPEMLVRRRGDRVDTRPIAGTAPRGSDPAEDARLAEALSEDPKERAEHVMLVDLARNDLGRVCESGSVEVSRFAGVEKYSHVQHLVSEVHGRLASGRGAADVLAACFPAGTLTGAPKIRAMELIDSLERGRRGVYGGAVGYLDAAGDLDMAIAIRTAVVESRRWRVQAGAGIVADSVPEREYTEAQNKAAALFRAIELAQSWGGSE